MDFRDDADRLLEVEHRRLLAARGDGNVAREVYDQLLEDYPSKSLDWVVSGEKWSGPQPIKIDDIDFSTEQRWQASRDPIEPYVDRISDGRMKPVILVRAPHGGKLIIVDGHHRVLAYKKLGKPALAYVGSLLSRESMTEALALHSLQKGGSSRGSWSVDPNAPGAAKQDGATPSLLPASDPMMTVRIVKAGDNTVQLQATTQLDLGPGDVHVPSAGNFRKAPKREQMAETTKKRNAAARLAQTGAAAKRKKRKAKPASAGPSFGGVRIRAQLGLGGHLHVRQMQQLSDVAGGKVVAFPGLVEVRGETDAPLTLGDNDGPVWIQVAKQGKFEGHAAGPFEMNADTFGQIVNNFRATKNREIPIDFEHASEQDPTLGSIPHEGAPAQGWIKDLRIGSDGNLYGLVEWGDLARQYIQDKKYKYFSPAIRFNSRDRVTGKPVGARMTSGALTNQPFLDGMAPLVARDLGDTGGGIAERMLIACSDKTTMTVYDDVPSFEMSGPSGAGYVHQPSEYMPAVREALSMHPLSMAKECADKLETLYDHLEAADFDYTSSHEGVDLSRPCCALRDLVGARIGDDWDDVFEKVRGLIQAAIDPAEMDDDEAEPSGHEEPDGDETVTIVAPASVVQPLLEAAAAAAAASTAKASDVDGPDGGVDGGAGDDEGGEEMRASGDSAGGDQVNSSSAVGTPPPAVPPTANTTESIPMSDPTTLKDVEAQNAVLASDLARATAEAVTLKDQITSAKAETASLSLKVTDLEGQLTSLKDANKTLSDAAAARIEADIVAAVDEAFTTYKDKKNLTDSSKENMLIVARHDMGKFLKEYPKLNPTERALLSNLTTEREQTTTTTETAPAVKIDGRRLALQISRQKGISLELAQQLADREIKRQRSGK